MGTCKDETSPKTDKTKKFLDKWRDKKGKTDSPKNESKARVREETAQSFLDHVVSSFETLGDMITQKEEDLADEKDRRIYNQEALAKLHSARYHLSEIIDICESYQGR